MCQFVTLVHAIKLTLSIDNFPVAGGLFSFWNGFFELEETGEL